MKLNQDKINMKVLVIIDVQNDFINGSLGSTEAQSKVPEIVKKIKSGSWDRIIVTQDTHEENYLETPEGKNLPVVHCVRGTSGWEIESSVQEALRKIDTDVVYLEKPTFGSFEVPEACTGAKEIELCGFCTDICVMANALILKTAYYDTARVIVDSSCCAGVTPEKHNAALEVFKSCQIEVK